MTDEPNPKPKSVDPKSDEQRAKRTLDSHGSADTESVEQVPNHGDIGKDTGKPSYIDPTLDTSSNEDLDVSHLITEAKRRAAESPDLPSERIGRYRIVKKLGSGAFGTCLLYTSPSPRDATLSRMPSSA